jgi:hypothetical protein
MGTCQSDAEIRKKGVKYRCRGNKTAVAQGLVVPQDTIKLLAIVQVQGVRFRLTEIEGFEEWDGEEILIPMTVEKIGIRCFFRAGNLAQVKFEPGSRLKQVEIGAFSQCPLLHHMDFGEGSKLHELAPCVFFKSGLRSIRIPSTCEKIGENCFYECVYLTEMYFDGGSHLKEIGRQAFFKCGFKSIRIPLSVEKLGNFCFCSCEDLAEVIFAGQPEFSGKVFDMCPLTKVKVPWGSKFDWPFPKDIIEFC